jgi:glucose-6-phosphate isomerase
MLSNNIIYKNFRLKKKYSKEKKIIKTLKNLIKFPSQILVSMSTNYKDSYKKKLITKYKKFNNFRVIGMGGSIFGAKAIFNFLKPKIKNFEFIDNLVDNNIKKKNSKKNINLIISKSGNTLETITNSNILINEKNINIFLTENKKSYLTNLAYKLKSDVVHHNNFIGGRYSVLSEVGMLPAELMGLKAQKFRQLNNLIKNKYFFNSLVNNVSSIYNLFIENKTNSIILNYDQQSCDIFNWYQQLVAESLGKDGKGILPIVSLMPQDNHSVMQYYLDGIRNNFFTFFFVREKNSMKINKNNLLNSFLYLENKTTNKILYSQFLATEKIFSKKKIPFRSFVVNNRNEKTLGELFIFFILETILLGDLIKVNPYNQPAVELIKNQTKNILISK